MFPPLTWVCPPGKAVQMLKGTASPATQSYPISYIQENYEKYVKLWKKDHFHGYSILFLKTIEHL